MILDFRRVPSGDIGRLLLRLAVGGLMLFHGLAKINRGIGFIEQSLQAAGLPGVIGYGVYLAELIAPALILVGYQARVASLVVAFEMLVIILFYRKQDIFALKESGGWGIEIEVLFMLASLALFFIGPGRYRVTIAHDDPMGL